MAHTVDSISIRGLRKAHLSQLAFYIAWQGREGSYYGPKDQFDKRHKDLEEFAVRLLEIVDDEDARTPIVRKGKT